MVRGSGVDSRSAEVPVLFAQDFLERWRGMVKGKALGLNRSKGLRKWQAGEYQFVSSTLGSVDDE